VGNQDGNVRIFLPGGERTVFTKGQMDTFTYKMDFTSPGGDHLFAEPAPGAASITLSLALGDWFVRSDAYDGENLVGTGTAYFTVSAGRSTSVKITMYFTDGNGYASDIDIEDFADPSDNNNPSLPVVKRFTVSNSNASGPGSWAYARDAITSGGSGNYVITLTEDITIPGRTANTFDDHTGIKVSLRGNGHTLSLDSLGSGGSLLVLGGEQTLILREATLVGIPNNNHSLVNISGKFIMRSGAITGNNSSNSSGGGVYVFTGATFKMHDGVISDNETSSDGGGVYVNNGIFDMDGGTISGNKATGTGLGNGGGGVYVAGNGDNFTMSGGTISGNEATGTGTNDGGGGVYVNDGTFKIVGGTIGSNNTAA
jgi:hypothetical protein